MADTRLSDADIGDILDNYLLQQNGNGKGRPPSPFDPSEALFGSDAFPALPSLWPHDNVVVGFWRSASPPACHLGP
jgi:hypothetical protein